MKTGISTEKLEIPACAQMTINNLIKYFMFSKIKAVQDLRTQANTIKKALENEIVEGQGGWGKIKIKMNGNQEVQSVEIAEDILSDKAKLESGMKEAVNDTIKKVQKVMASKMSEIGGFNLPGMGK